MILFYDFEVFPHDWLVVFNFPSERREEVIVNDRKKLRAFYEKHKADIWVGFNSNHYDRYILEAIFLGDINVYELSRFIIPETAEEKRQKPQAWQFDSRLGKLIFNSYDIKSNIDRSLKYFEASMGNSIEESSVSFNKPSKLTDAEIEETIKYCKHDVEQTICVFMERYSDFEAQMGLLKMFNLPLSDISKTKVQLSAKILGANKRYYDDEFEIDFPPTMRIEKYQEVIDWYKNPNNMDYFINPCTIQVAGITCVFGWGGVHGAPVHTYREDGYFVNMDVASLYPSLMIEYNLLSRSCHPQKFKDIVNLRLKYKAEKNPLQKPLKIVINGTYGASKDKNNPLYDPRQANRVCVYGQLLLLDLMEHLEPWCDIVQCNTDGVLVKLRATNEKDADREYQRIDDIAYEWEQRTHLNLEFDEYKRVIQKDVNNYIIVAPDGHLKTKGAYVKKVGNLDYDLAIVNKAVVDYLAYDIPVKKTINESAALKDFQLTKRITEKYDGFILNGSVYKLKTARCFASKNENDYKLHKYKHVNGEFRESKVENTPTHCRLVNGDINGLPVPDWLDRQWYINLAEKRINEFRDGTNKFITE